MKKKLIIGGIACVLLAILLLIICLPAVFAKDEKKFVYELQNDCYVIKDIKNNYRDGWFGKEKLVVPATYKNKKVVTLEKIEASSLRELVISDGIVTISDKALTYNTKMTKVTLPDSLKNLGAEALANTGIESIIIPQNVASIGEGAFGGCNMLKEITVADNNSVYHSAGNCLIETASKTLVTGCDIKTIPSDGSVTSIGNSAFLNKANLTNVTIPDVIISIGNSAFSGCSGLTEITIPDSVTSIGKSAFNDTAFYKNSSNWQDGALYIGKYLISATLSGTYTIKDGTKLLAYNAFSTCSGLTEITIPVSVTSIGNSAFNGCSKLTSITFNGTIEQWKAIKKDSSWDTKTGNYTVHCTDGDLAKNDQ